MTLLPVSSFCIILLIPYEALTEELSPKPIFTWNCCGIWLATPGWSGKAAEVPSAHSSNVTPARYNHYLRAFKTSDHSGTYSALGSRWEETHRVPGTAGDVQGQRLVEILCRSFLLQSPQSTGSLRNGQEEGHSIRNWSRRESLKVIATRADPWAAAGRQAGAWSTPAGSPERWCMMLRDPKHLMTPGHITDGLISCLTSVGFIIFWGPNALSLCFIRVK